MIEVELKSVVDDWTRCRRAVEVAGGVLTFEGELEDRRYDLPDRSLMTRDHVLRVRTYRTAGDARVELEWKGPTRCEDGYKSREEIGTSIGDGASLTLILTQLGYRATTAIDRTIAQYTLFGATVRFERYPRLDDLVEVEGEPAGIERAIAILGLPRDGYSTDRLSDFVARYQSRTGLRAATSLAQLAREG